MSIRQSAIKGIKWTTVSTISLNSASILKIAVLARLLDKSDFGLMALVTFVMGFMNLFMDMGLSSAILHKQQITRKEYSSLFWINIFSSLILFILISLSSPAIALFYEESELSKLIPLMALSIILAALGRQFKTIEQKNLNFRYLALTEITGSFAGVVTAIMLAIKGAGVYALIIGLLVQYIVTNGILFIKGLKLKVVYSHFNFKETKPFLSIGIYLVGGQIINYFSRDLDVLIIGKFLGTEILGGYSLAKQFVRKPLQVIKPIITRVASSLLPRYQNDHSALRKYFMELLSGLSILYAFIYASIAILASTLVLIFFGPELSSISIYVQLFSVVLFFRSIGSNVGILVITTGRTDYDFYWNILTMLITSLAIFVGAHISIEMLIIMLGLVQLILLIPGWYVFYYRLIKLEIKSFLEIVLIPFTISLINVIITVLFLTGSLVGEIFMCFLLFVLLTLYSYIKHNEIKYLVNKLYLKYIK